MEILTRLSILAQPIREGSSIHSGLRLHKDGGAMDEVSITDRPQKYLLVDDHAAFRQTVKDFLPGAHVKVIECSDGAEAVARFKEHQPDWTLMDIQMPGLDGFRATRSIRSHHPRARVIILSQHDSRELREAAREAGAVAYVQKDRLKDLPGIISSLLEEPPPTIEPDRQP